MNAMLVDTSPDGLSQFLSKIYSLPILSDEREKELALDYKVNNNLDAAHQLVTSHLKLVVAYARKYTGYNLPLGDLIQEGCIGLMKAVRNFDLSFNVKLSTYAIPYIKADILEYVINNFTIVKVATTKAKRKLFFNLRSMYEKTNLQIAGELDVKEDEVEEMRVALHSGFQTSFNDPDEDDESFHPENYIEDNSNNPQLLLENKQVGNRNSQVLEAIKTLTEREQRIIRARYLQEEPEVLEVLSKELNISKERVRQIEVATISKLRKLLE